MKNNLSQQELANKLGNDVNGKTLYSEEQNQILNMLVKLNDANTTKVHTYITGLLDGQN